MVQLFERFAEMVEKLPAKAVPKAIQLERQMLERDMAQKRTLPLADVRSIVAFCSFLEEAQNTAGAPKISVPIQHLGFYRQTVNRLVQGGELPAEAAEHFDKAFSAMLKAA